MTDAEVLILCHPCSVHWKVDRNWHEQHFFVAGGRDSRWSMLRRLYPGAGSGEAGAAQVPGSAPELDMSLYVDMCFTTCMQLPFVFLPYVVQQVCMLEVNITDLLSMCFSGKSTGSPNQPCSRCRSCPAANLRDASFASLTRRSTQQACSAGRPQLWTGLRRLHLPLWARRQPCQACQRAPAARQPRRMRWRRSLPTVSTRERFPPRDEGAHARGAHIKRCALLHTIMWKSLGGKIGPGRGPNGPLQYLPRVSMDGSPGYLHWNPGFLGTMQKCSRALCSSTQGYQHTLQSATLCQPGPYHQPGLLLHYPLSSHTYPVIHTRVVYLQPTSIYSPSQP